MENETIHSRIKEARKKAGLNQKDLADKLHITPQSMSAFEKDKCPSLDNLRRIAEVLNVSVDWLLGMEKPKASNYADLLNLLDDLAVILDTPLRTTGFYLDHDDNPHYDFSFMCDYTAHHPLFDALDKMQTMRSLLENGTIDKGIYDTWFRQTMTDLANTPINRKKGKGETNAE